MSESESVLIIGPPRSGKTVFLSQLYSRVKKRKSKVTLIKTPDDISAITNAVKSLAAGNEPEATPAGESVQLVLPIMVNGVATVLKCPDYGGEQVSFMTEVMEIDAGWKHLINSSDRWMLFIRPHDISPEYDLSITSYETIHVKQGGSLKARELSQQSKYIELLQTLLFAKEIGAKERVDKPQLKVVLTCWDELDTEKTPLEILKDKLPMFLEFIHSNWADSALGIYGLSAQEFSLDSENAKDKYLDECPESFGYMIHPDGSRDSDITKLLELAILSS